MTEAPYTVQKNFIFCLECVPYLAPSVTLTAILRDIKLFAVIWRKSRVNTITCIAFSELQHDRNYAREKDSGVEPKVSVDQGFSTGVPREIVIEKNKHLF
jgi:hypothetical protein